MLVVALRGDISMKWRFLWLSDQSFKALYAFTSFFIFNTKFYHQHCDFVSNSIQWKNSNSAEYLENLKFCLCAKTSRNIVIFGMVICNILLHHMISMVRRCGLPSAKHHCLIENDFAFYRIWYSDQSMRSSQQFSWYFKLGVYIVKSTLNGKFPVVKSHGMQLSIPLTDRCMWFSRFPSTNISIAHLKSCVFWVCENWCGIAAAGKFSKELAIGMRNGVNVKTIETACESINSIESNVYGNNTHN